REFEEIKFGAALAESLQRVSAPESLWSEMEALLDRQPQDTASPAKASIFAFPMRSAQFAALCVSSLLIVIVVVWVFIPYNQLPKPSWGVTSLEGAPKVGSRRIGDTGRLGVGEWLETDGASRAKIEVGGIGQVEIEPNTRVKLVETRETEH